MTTINVVASSKTLSNKGDMTADSFALATIRGFVQGLHVAGVSVDGTANTITIRLNKAAPSAVKIGWFVIN